MKNVLTRISKDQCVSRALAVLELWALEGEEPSLLALVPVMELPKVRGLEQHWLQLELPGLAMLMSGAGQVWVFEALELVEEPQLSLFQEQ